MGRKCFIQQFAFFLNRLGIKLLVITYSDLKEVERFSMLVLSKRKSDTWKSFVIQSWRLRCYFFMYISSNSILLGYLSFIHSFCQKRNTHVKVFCKIYSSEMVTVWLHVFNVNLIIPRLKYCSFLTPLH